MPHAAAHDNSRMTSNNPSAFTDPGRDWEDITKGGSIPHARYTDSVVSQISPETQNVEFVDLHLEAIDTVIEPRMTPNGVGGSDIRA